MPTAMRDMGHSMKKIIKMALSHKNLAEVSNRT
jgi:hypothetical protein